MSVLATQPIALPLAINDHGIVLVGGTRVTLDSVIYAFKSGASAEQIAQQYPSLALDDIYVVIAYYLKNAGAVETYLGERKELRKNVQRDSEARFDPTGLRDRLLARQKT